MPNSPEMGESVYYPVPFPIGEGKSDYEKYIGTQALLNLPKNPNEVASPDEALFQITHQTSELWMQLMQWELDKALEEIPAGHLDIASRSINLTNSMFKLLTAAVDQLGEYISIVEYAKIRTVLGQGSGMESPGFNRLLKYPEKMWPVFEKLLLERNVDLKTVYLGYRENFDLYTLAEAYMTFDDLFHKWRTHHFDLVIRTIGIESNSLKGIPTKVLQRGVIERCFPKLIALRSELTNESGLAYGGQALS